MEMPIGEIFDRYTIVKLKFEKLKNGAEIADQLKLYEKEVEIQINKLDSEKKAAANQLLKELFRVNSIIWDLEQELRDGFENNTCLEEIGKTAIEIRNYNGIRVRTKNEFYTLFNQTIFREIKINHISKTDDANLKQ
jgi:hypothetical protein